MIKKNDVIPVFQFGKISSYLTTISLMELYSFKGNIYYNPVAQRGLDENNQPLIDKKHVANIRDSFLNKKCIRGHLTWNLNSRDFQYDKESKTLFISQNARITIPDSAHRHFALFEAYEQANDLDMLNSSFVVEIFVLDQEEEKDYFATVNGKSKPVYRNRFLYLSNDIGCKLIREAIENSLLKNNVEYTKQKAVNKLVKFSTLYDAFILSGDFKVTEENYKETLDWISSFLSELYKSRAEFKEDKSLVKEKTMLVEEIIWWGYSRLARALVNDSNWKRTLKNKMNKKVTLDGGKKVDFFSKGLYLWHGSVIKGVYNPITEKTDYGSSVINSGATKNRVRNLFINNIL